MRKDTTLTSIINGATPDDLRSELPDGSRWYEIPSRRADGTARPVGDDSAPLSALSVTAALDQMSSGYGLRAYTARGTAAEAVEQLPRLVAALMTPDCDGHSCGGCLRCVTEEIAAWHRRDSAESTERGSRVHHAVYRYLTGGGDPADDDDIYPYFGQFMTFMADHALLPEDVVLSELVVANLEHGYAGTADLAVRLHPSRTVAAAELAARLTGGFDASTITVMVDLKSRDRETEAFYPEAGHQVCAYAHAPTAIVDGIEYRMPRIDAGAVLQVRPNGYAVRPVDVSGEAFAGFVAILNAARVLLDPARNPIRVRRLPDEMQASDAADRRVGKALMEAGKIVPGSGAQPISRSDAATLRAAGIDPTEVIPPMHFPTDGDGRPVSPGRPTYKRREINQKIEEARGAQAGGRTPSPVRPEGAPAGLLERLRNEENEERERKPMSQRKRPEKTRKMPTRPIPAVTFIPPPARDGDEPTRPARPASATTVVDPFALIGNDGEDEIPF